MENKILNKAKGYVYKPTGNIIEEGFYPAYENYIFLDREIELLCDGLDIIAENEESRAVLVRLEEIEEVDKKVFKVLKAIPRKTLSHIWDSDEKDRLYKGEYLLVDDLYDPRTCKYFEGICKWDKYEREVKVYIRY